jgi:TIR domain
VKVFLSWSGDRSKAVAEALGAWLAQVIQAVEPWLSSGIEKGARWQSEIADRLDEAKVGIVCLTSGNLNAPWILFEAGALSKTKGSYVCTFLLDITPSNVEPPLGQFQHTPFSRQEVLKLVRNINEYVQKSGDRALSDQILTKMFDAFWPQLETQLSEIKNRPKPKTHPRTERQLLEEILEILRSQQQRVRTERKDEEFAKTLNSLIVPNWETDARTSRALELYMNILKGSEKEVAGKARKVAKEKEPSDVNAS